MPLHDRRQILGILGTVLATPGIAQNEPPAVSRPTAYAFSFKLLEGPDLRLAEYSGKPILVVNTASLCGYTPQYAGLQSLWTRFADKGLLILGVPSNDFGGQEPGAASDISHAAHQQYGVTFPLTAKVEVKGPNAHPFYRWAAAERPLDTPRWNFHKYLVGHAGRIVAAFPSEIEPADARVVTAIAKELAASSS